MTQAQPETIRDNLVDDIEEAIRSNDQKTFDRTLSGLYDLYEKHNDLRAFTKWAQYLFVVDKNASLEAFANMANNLELNNENPDSVDFYVHYVVMLSRFRDAYKDFNHKILTKRSNTIINTLFQNSIILTNHQTWTVFLAIFENNRDELWSLILKKYSGNKTIEKYVSFFLMNVIILKEGKQDKALAIFNKLSVIANPSWEHKKSLRNLRKTLNALYQDCFISQSRVTKVDSEAQKKDGLIEFTQSRISRSLNALTEILANQVSKNMLFIPESPPVDSKDLMIQILTENGEVFDELVHR